MKKKSLILLILTGVMLQSLSSGVSVLALTNDSEKSNIEKEDKDLNVSKGENIFTIENDSSLTEKSIMNKNINQAYINDFKNRIGEENINDFKNTDSIHKKFIDWIVNNPIALREYLQGGYASNNTENDMGSYQYKNKLNKKDELKALNIWFDIWNKYPDSHDGVNLRIAIATALEFSNGINTWLTNSPIDPSSRYNFFADAYSNNQLMSDFSQYNVKKIRNIVNAKASNEDMQWLRKYIKEKHSNMLNRNNITSGYTLLKYIETNPEGKSVYGPDFYGKNPTIEKVIEYGGVCGAMSKFSSVLAQTFGVPAFPVGQPGHCAFVYLDSNHNYKLGYDIFGWEKSAGYDSTLPYIFINNNLSKNKEKYYNSDANMRLANNTSNKDEALKLINLAIKEEPLNYEAWKIKFKLLLENPNIKENELTNTISEFSNTFSKYPVIKDGILWQMNKKNQEIKFLGLGDWQYANLKVNYDTNKIQIQTYEGNPHVYFGDNSYEKIEIIDNNGKIVYTKDFIGNETIKNNLTEIPIKQGYEIKLISQEPGRVRIFDNTGEQELKYGSLNKNVTFKITKDGLVKNNL